METKQRGDGGGLDLAAKVKGASPDVQKVLGGAQDALTVRRVFGEPFEKDGVTYLPVAKVTGGGGGGGGGGDAAGRGSGVGFGVSAKPVGLYVLKDGDALWRPAMDVSAVALRGQLVGIVALLVLRSIVKALAKRR